MVWRKKNTALQPKNVQSTVKFSGGNVKFWGCFSASGVGNLVFNDVIMDQYVYLNILKKNLVNELGLSASYRFQQDNDPKHVARSVQNWLDQNVQNQLKTPLQSPDLNPIEHLWKILKDNIEKNHKVTNKIQLKAAILAEWGNIDVSNTQKLVDSMEDRLFFHKFAPFLRQFFDAKNDFYRQFCDAKNDFFQKCGNKKKI